MLRLSRFLCCHFFSTRRLRSSSVSSACSVTRLRILELRPSACNSSLRNASRASSRSRVNLACRRASFALSFSSCSHFLSKAMRFCICSSWKSPLISRLLVTTASCAPAMIFTDLFIAACPTSSSKPFSCFLKPLTFPWALSLYRELLGAFDIPFQK